MARASLKKDKVRLQCKKTGKVFTLQEVEQYLNKADIPTSEE